jgi:small subunit ribosomal protein SAe
LILTDPRLDFNALKESSYVNIPIIALCNTDNTLGYVDCAIPCNNRSKRSLAMVYWLLAREVGILTGKVKEGEQLSELVDMFLYRDVDKEDKVEKAEEEGNYQEEGVEADEEPAEEDFVGN